MSLTEISFIFSRNHINHGERALSYNGVQRLSTFAKSQLTCSSPLLPLFKHLHSLIGRVYGLQVFIIKGSAKNTDCTLNVLFFGSKETAHQFAHLAYSKIEKMQPTGKLLSFQIDPSHTPNVDVIAACVRKSTAGKFLKHNYLVLPCLSFNLDLHNSMENIIRKCSRRRRRDIKRLQDQGYSYVVHRKNPKYFDFFYQKMYYPYTKGRFGNAALLRGYLNSQMAYRRNGGIIFIQKEDRPIAGILFNIRGKTLYALNFGVYRGNQCFMRELAGQAALFFLIEWAKMKDMTRLNYGLSMPFFTDGNFQYKKEWGMFLEKHEGAPFCVLKINRLNKGSLSFLLQNPFILLDKRSLKGVVFINHMPTTVELRQIFSEYLLPKLDSIIVIAYYSQSAYDITRTEFLTSLRKPLNTLPKPLQNVCSLLARQGFTVETAEYANCEAKINQSSKAP